MGVVSLVRNGKPWVLHNSEETEDPQCSLTGSLAVHMNGLSPLGGYYRAFFVKGAAVPDIYDCDGE